MQAPTVTGSLKGSSSSKSVVAIVRSLIEGASPLEVTHIWREDGVPRSASRTIPLGTAQLRYRIDTPPGAEITNQAIIFEAR